MYKKTSIQKKIFIFMILALMLVLSACSGSGSATTDNTGNEEATAPQALAMGTGGISGVWYPVGGSICNVISEATGASATAQATAGSVENLRLLAQGEVELGIANTAMVAAAVAGEEAFKDQPVSNVAGIAVMLPIQTQIVVRADSDINSLADLKGKKVGVGAPGSGDEVEIRQMLKAIGMTYDDIDEQMLSYAEQATSFKDRQLDAMFAFAGAPTSAIMDAASQEKVRLLAIDDATCDKIIKEYPFNAKKSLPANTYQFQSEPAQMLEVGTLLFCSTDLSEDVVYNITKAIFENQETLQKCHEQMKTFSIDTALDGMPIDLHPGAEKYYREVGIIK